MPVRSKTDSSGPELSVRVQGLCRPAPFVSGNDTHLLYGPAASMENNCEILFKLRPPPVSPLEVRNATMPRNMEVHIISCILKNDTLLNFTLALNDLNLSIV